MASRPEAESRISIPDSPFLVHRVASQGYPIFDGTGAQRWGARWNSRGRRVIYAAQYYSGALLEVLVHAGGQVPKTQARVEISIPAGLEVERLLPDDLPGWDEPASRAAREFGDCWFDQRRTPVLMVPSVITVIENNVLINQEHPDFSKIKAGEPALVRWDQRLLPRR